MQKYASRITAISSCSLRSSLSFGQLLAIAVHYRATVEPLPPLFSKLQEIMGVILTPDNVALFYWFKGTSLSRLGISSLEGDLASQTLIDFISDMGTIYPNMKTFCNDSFLGEEHSDVMVRAVSKTITSWKHLVDVYLNSIDLDTAAYEHLMRLESLASLNLMLFYRSLPRLRQAVLPQRPFPVLRDLTLVDCDNHIPWIVEWLDCLHLSPSILCCTTRVSSAEAQQVSSLCRAIATQLCHESLETIILMNHGSSTSVEVDSIRPLFSFSRLRRVRIAHLCSTSLSDEDLHQLAASWPLLQVLHLNYYAEPQTVTPTLKGFCHLLQHCPDLQELTIVIDTRDSDWIDVARPVVCNPLMHYVGLGNSFLDDSKRVAAILFAILPSVKEINTTCWSEDPLYYPPEGKPLWLLWKEVNRHLGELWDRRDGDGGHGSVVPPGLPS